MDVLVCTQSNVGYVASVLSHLMANQGREHWEGKKWVFCLESNVSFLYRWMNEGEEKLRGFLDTNIVTYLDKRQIIDRVCIHFVWSGNELEAKFHSQMLHRSQVNCHHERREEISMVEESDQRAQDHAKCGKIILRESNRDTLDQKLNVLQADEAHIHKKVILHSRCNGRLWVSRCWESFHGW